MGEPKSDPHSIRSSCRPRHHIPSMEKRSFQVYQGMCLFSPPNPSIIQKINMFFYHKDNNVPTSDIMNLDETGIKMIPASGKTLAPKGSKQVPGQANKGIAQITKVTMCTHDGELAPYMLIFAGLTDLVHPRRVPPPKGCVYSHSPNHWANEDTTIKFVKEIIVPFVQAKRQARREATRAIENEDAVGEWAVLIWDGFAPHKRQPVVDLLLAHRIKPFVLPPNCTSAYQPLDRNFNGPEKVLLTNHFSTWLATEFKRFSELGRDVLNVIPAQSSLKRAFIAKLVAGVHEVLTKRQEMILNAWRISQLDFSSSMATDPIPEDGEEIERIHTVIVDDLQQLMAETCIIIPEIDEVDEEDLLTPPTGTFVESDHNQLTLIHNSRLFEGLVAPYESEQSQEIETIDEDSNFSSPTSMSRASSSVSSNPATCGVFLAKHGNGKTIRVTYEDNSRKATHSQVKSYLLSQNDLKALEIGEAFHHDREGYYIDVTGYDRTTVLRNRSYLIF
jgi:hypothetical protein